MSKRSGTPAAIRPASAEDAEAIYEIMYRDPPPEILAITGDPEVARSFGRILPLVPARPGTPEETFVWDAGSEVLGVLQGRVGASDPRTTAGLLPGLIRILIRQYPAWSWARMLRRLTIRTRLQFPPVEGAYHITEIHVHPERRNLGIGTRLLRFAEEEARRKDCQRMSLSTTASNPARRLYERMGYAVADQKTTPEYEAITGIRGRVLLVKELEPRPGVP